jgi:hypothetical protein
MKAAKYYREMAASARAMVGAADGAGMKQILTAVSVDYDDIATDLEDGLIELVYPELLPQNHHNNG